jgi:hypothetical protein
MREQNQLTSERLRAINQMRFETARTALQYDSNLARDIIFQVQRLDPKFEPTGLAAPRHYRFLFRSLGFQAAERLAAVVRKWHRGGSSLIRKWCTPHWAPKCTWLNSRLLGTSKKLRTI